MIKKNKIRATMKVGITGRRNGYETEMGIHGALQDQDDRTH